jgi:hypothetical protein
MARMRNRIAGAPEDRSAAPAAVPDFATVPQGMAKVTPRRAGRFPVNSLTS